MVVPAPDAAALTASLLWSSDLIPTGWLRRGRVPERVVTEIRGHSTLAMVKRYQHVLPELTVTAAERLDRVMGR